MKDHEHLQQIADRLNGVLELLSVGSDYRLSVKVERKDGGYDYRLPPQPTIIQTENGGSVTYPPLSRNDHNMGCTE